MGFEEWWESTSPEFAYVTHRHVAEIAWQAASQFAFTIAAPDMLTALRNIRDTIESCYIAGGWVPLDEEEMESIASIANGAITKSETGP